MRLRRGGGAQCLRGPRCVRLRDRHRTAPVADRVHRGSGIWTIQTGIFPENLASLALHERCGFRIVGRRERLGMHFGTWRDEPVLERRSSVVDRRHRITSVQRRPPGAEAGSRRWWPTTTPSLVVLAAIGTVDLLPLLQRRHGHA